MSRNYPRLRMLSDGWMPAVLAALGSAVPSFGPFAIADDEDDLDRCTDLVGRDGLRIAVRVRDSGNERYRDLATVRSRVVSGRDTELHKLLGGRAPDLYLFGVADLTGGSLAHWRLVWGPGLAAVLGEMRGAGQLAEVDAVGDGTAFVEVDLGTCAGIVLARHDEEGLIDRQTREGLRARLRSMASVGK